MIVKKQQASKSAPGSATDGKPPKIEKEDDSPASGVNEDVTMQDAETPIKDENGEDNANAKRFAWEHVDEIMALLKTAFPLLTLSIETMIDQIIHKLKPSTDEDIYRLIVALMNDGVQQLARDPSDSGNLTHATEINLQRFAESMYPNHLKVSIYCRSIFLTPFSTKLHLKVISSKPNRI